MRVKRTSGTKIKYFTPKHIYDRKRQKYHYDLKAGKITDSEYDLLVENNYEDFKLSKKMQNNKKLDEFTEKPED